MDSDTAQGLATLPLNYYAALAFGAVVVVLFARDQFNRPSYEGARELTRLIALLTPSAMRRRNVYWRAYCFYAGILLLIYFVLCAYGLILAPALGWSIPGYEQEPSAGASALPSAPNVEPPLAESGYNPDDRPQQVGEGRLGQQSDTDRFGSDPIIPLIVSLTMVGLAPSFPLLVRAEAKIRFVAHQLSGIPTRLIKGERKLRETPLHLGSGSDHLLIPPKDWRRLAHYMEKADVDDPDALREDLEKILAFRSWVLQQRLTTANLAIRDNLAKFETDIRREVDRLIFSLDALSGFEGTPGARNATAEPSGGEFADLDRRRIAWESVAVEADQVCGDISVLSMLYVEHGILPTEGTAEAFGWAVNPGEGALDQTRQKFLAEQKLVRYLSTAVRYVDHEGLAMSLWLKATAAALVVSFLIGAISGLDPALDKEQSITGGSRIAIGLVYVAQGAMTYALALLVGLSWHESAHRTNAWSNVFEHHWARWIWSLGAIFVLAGAASLVSVVGLNFVLAIGGVGIDLVVRNAGLVLLAGFEYEGPRALLGSFLVLFVVLILDAWRSADTGGGWLRWLPWGAGGTMFAVGVATRLISTQVGAANDNRNFVLKSWEVWEPALSAGAWAGLVGLAVTLSISGSLRHDFMGARPSGSSDGGLLGTT